MVQNKVVDMSPEAIEQRLRDLGQLYELGVALRTARKIGTIKNTRESCGKNEPADGTGSQLKK